MALKYDFYEVNELNNTEGKFRARAVSTGKIDTNRLAKWISQCSGVSAAETKGFIEILTDSILDFITDGYEVEVGKLGYFSATVTSKLVDTPHEIRAESIRFNRLNFRAGIEVKKRIRNVDVERIVHSRSESRKPKSTREQRAEKLKVYLAGKRVLTRADYSRLTGVQQKNMAVDDLNAFVQEGWLERYGAGRTVVYMLGSI